MAANLTRRQMLRLTGLLSATALLAACDATEPAAPATDAPTLAATPARAIVSTAVPSPPAPKPADVTIMMEASALSEDDLRQFSADYSPITLTRVDFDRAVFFAAVAAGSPPDIVRTEAPDIPFFLARNLLKNIQPYFEASDVLIEDDLLPVNGYYRAEGPTAIGAGPRYGLASDWSPDGFLWINERVFERAGVRLPDPTAQPISSVDLVQLARATTELDGDRAEILGFNLDTGLIDRFWLNLAKMGGGSLFSADFKRATLVGNRPAVDAIRLFYDLMWERTMNSPLYPSVAGFARDFVNAQLAMACAGYGFAGQLKALAQADNATGEAREGLAQNRWKMHPMFSYKRVRSNPSLIARGAAVLNPDLRSAPPTNPNPAWTAFEWFMGKEPAGHRAANGRGLPALRSLLPLLPQETEFDKQVFATAQAELDHAGEILNFNPYLPSNRPTVLGKTFLDNLGPMLIDGKPFDDVLADMERETNAAIQQGFDAL